jgi:NADPH:quinone reductase-like Zn-dependent oxidoreductase
MLAAYAARQSAEDPLSGLEVGEIDSPAVPDGWVRVRVRVAALNHHDVWSLRGVGLPSDRLPMILGCDAAGVLDDGTEVLVHAVISDPSWLGDETMDPRRSLLSEVYPGTLAEEVWVPARNVVHKPRDLSFEYAACLPTSWLTAYRMLFTNSGVTPGGSVLVQGAGGGVATALIQLGSAAGYRMFVTSRDEAKAERALELGAVEAVATGERLSTRVDAVMETVGAATWSHSVNSLHPGGTIVISGATSGDAPARAELTKIFFKQLRVIGSTMGSRTELERLTQLVTTARIEPAIDSIHPLKDAAVGFAAMARGDVVGKILFTL